MSGDVIALDPLLLAGLEGHLQGFADGCRRRAGRIGDELAGTGVAAPGAVDLLERVAAWCAAEHLDVAWRRAAIEAMDGSVPLTTITFATPAEARAAGEDLAERLLAAQTAPSPSWSMLHDLVVEVDRRAGDPVFAAAVLHGLGARRTRELSLVLRSSWRASVDDPPAEAPLEVVAAQDVVLGLVRAGSRATGEDALGVGWVRGYLQVPATSDDPAAVAPERAAEADRVEAALTGTGHGATFAGIAAEGARFGRVSAVLSGTGAVLGLVTAPMALDDGDGAECDVPQAAFGAAAGAVSLLAAATGGPVGLTLAAALLGGASTVMGACTSQSARRNETTPRAGPDGQQRLPSGSHTNPHVDGAGVPLPPAYG